MTLTYDDLRTAFFIGLGVNKFGFCSCSFSVQNCLQLLVWNTINILLQQKSITVIMLYYNTGKLIYGIRSVGSTGKGVEEEISDIRSDHMRKRRLILVK